jgi:D-3-phosphoglycerate dehydrogenase
VKNILITTSSFGTMDASPLAALRHAGFNPILNPHCRKLTEDEAIALITEHQPVGIVAGVEPLTRRVMTSGSQLKAIARCGIGMDSVDLDAAKELGIRVTNTPDAPTQAVAEITLGAMICLLRGIDRSSSAIHGGQWERPMGSLLACQTVGILGMGRIGTRLVSLLKPYGCRILAHDPVVTSFPDVTMVDAQTLYSQSDIVSVHVPYMEQTHHLINASVIEAMKPGAFLLNYSRGGLVDETALERALSEKRLGGVAMDCFEQEPYTGPLRNYPNAVLTGHIGSYAREGRVIQETQAVENLLSSLEQ